MKNIYVKTDRCNDKLFEFPIVDSNISPLKEKKVCIFDSSNIVNPKWLSDVGAEVHVNPDLKETSFTNIGIIAPIWPTNDGESGYYEVLDYYVSILQMMIHKQKNINGFNHIVVILPPYSDELGTSLLQMAHYAIGGLVKGLAKIYAQSGLFINAIVLNEGSTDTTLEYWIKLLSSDNSNNIVGQVFKL